MTDKLTKDAVGTLEIRLHPTLRRWPNDDEDKQTFYRLIDLAREHFEREAEHAKAPFGKCEAALAALEPKQ
jgi:hypothetical protein